MLLNVLFIFSSCGAGGLEIVRRMLPESLMSHSGLQATSASRPPTTNLRTTILDHFRGVDSSRILILRGGILMSIGNFPEMLSRRTPVGIILVGRLGVHESDLCVDPTCEQRPSKMAQVWASVVHMRRGPRCFGARFFSTRTSGFFSASGLKQHARNECPSEVNARRH